ncbi:hypothetical protein [Planctomycetes bacterium Poly30]|uniref:hypothetical protein n=1 Tax=Saltatorellus ferox TaxID=2528018 RepID=UPI0011A28F21
MRNSTSAGSPLLSLLLVSLVAGITAGLATFLVLFFALGGAAGNNQEAAPVFLPVEGASSVGTQELLDAIGALTVAMERPDRYRPVADSATQSHGGLPGWHITMGEARSFGQVPFRPDELSGEIGYGLVPLTV